MTKKGHYYGLFGLRAHRRYLATLTRKDWELFRAFGGTVRGLAAGWHARFNMATEVEVRYSKGARGLIYVVAYFPVVLPIRGTGN